MLYKNVWIDLECLYMPELITEQSEQFITGKQPCVAFLPDVERGFESVEAAKIYMDNNLNRIQKKCEAVAKKYNLPF